MNQLSRLALATRVFGLAAVTGLVVLSANYQLFPPILVLAVLGTTVVFLSATSPLPPIALVTTEAVVSGLLIGTAMPDGAALLPYLAAISLVAGLIGGLIAIGVVLLGELAAMTLVLLSWSAPMDAGSLVTSLGPWILSGLGLGLLGAWLRSAGGFGRPSVDPSYEAAYRLVSQLRTVAKRLSFGLDSTLIAREISAEVVRTAHASDVAVFVRSERGGLAPIAYWGDDAATLPTPDAPQFAECWAEDRPAALTDSNGLIVGLPLRAGSRLVGIVLARPPERLSSRVLADLASQLNDSALRLDTALVFDQVRSIATSEERHRLAREIHDGIAQEIAGLGYAVDDLTQQANSEVQKIALGALRQELTRIVTELRLSIFDLRSEVVGGSGLGQALSDYMLQMGARSNMTVHLTLDEAATRLRPEVEGELLRIVQEAANNARKHSGAHNLWVTCRVAPPTAEIEVRDDGCGLGSVRNDSYGLRIMKERADRLGATLEVCSLSDEQSGGTLVRVAIGGASNEAEGHESGAPDDVRI